MPWGRKNILVKPWLLLYKHYSRWDIYVHNYVYNIVFDIHVLKIHCRYICTMHVTYVGSLTNWVIFGVELVKTMKGVSILWEEPVNDASDDIIQLYSLWTNIKHTLYCAYITDYTNLGHIRPILTLLLHNTQITCNKALARPLVDDFAPFGKLQHHLDVVIYVRAPIG